MKKTSFKGETPFLWEMGKIPFSEYPRPQMRRDNWINLNGKWDFAVLKKGKEVYRGEILVPFPMESPLSGVERRCGKNEMLRYQRSFSLPEAHKTGRTLLHFGAVDQICRVFLNGAEIGKNEGGYLPFTFDITSHLAAGENTLTVLVSDGIDPDYPYGKQTKKPHGMWYTPASGIWQTVWLERVPERYISSFRILPDEKGITLFFEGEGKKTLTVTTEKGPVTQFFYGDRVRFDPDFPHLWSPEDPYLYDFTLAWGEDRVQSYFGLRKIEIKKGENRSWISLNSKPYFFHGLLDQGYFPDGLFLPATERGYLGDILTAKACGFNTLRKHLKLEPEIFYYYCDKYGIAVFQDMINSGTYSFLLDTALPTLFLKKGISHKASSKRREEFCRTCRGILSNLYNHPSVLYYTIFNEGWGQFDADAMYRLLKNEDDSRLFDTFSGWFKEKESDVQSEHLYFKAPYLFPEGEKPLILSEYGGYSHRVAEHYLETRTNWGYGTFKTREALEEATLSLLAQVEEETKKGLCGAVLTQLSDVEGETNGILTYDRQVLKLSPEKMMEAAKKIRSAYEKAARKDGAE